MAQCYCQKKNQHAGKEGYICNLTTGRWIQLNGTTYKKVFKEMGPTVFSSSMTEAQKKICQCPSNSQFSKNANYQCNPQSGRWIKKSGPTALKLQNLQPRKPLTTPSQPTGYSVEMTKYLMFLLNKQKTAPGKTYSQIIQYNTTQLEDDHQFIQWLFPLTEPSPNAPNAPVIDILELHQALKKEYYILPKMKLSYQLILGHWGFETIESHQPFKGALINPFKERSPTKPYFSLQASQNINTKIKLLNGHNGLRLSRVLQSLVYHGLINLAKYTLEKVLQYQSLLKPTMHKSGVTLWQYLLNKAIDSHKKIISHLPKNPKDYLIKIIGDIGQIKDLPLLNPSVSFGDFGGKPQIDAVVNAANASLATGGGVTGALVKSVGGATEWNSLMKKAKNSEDKSQLKLKIGEAVYTPTQGQLLTDRVKYIIHTLGPVAGVDDISLVKTSIFNTLKMADHLHVKTLILPAISGGIFASGNPLWSTEVRKLIVEEIKNYMNNQPTQIQTIYLISIDEKDQKLWESK